MARLLRRATKHQKPAPVYFLLILIFGAWLTIGLREAVASSPKRSQPGDGQTTAYHGGDAACLAQQWVSGPQLLDSEGIGRSGLPMAVPVDPERPAPAGEEHRILWGFDDDWQLWVLGSHVATHASLWPLLHQPSAVHAWWETGSRSAHVASLACWGYASPQGPVVVATGRPLVRHRDAVLGFAVDVPSDWEITGPTVHVDPLGQSWVVVRFESSLYAYDSQAFGKYEATVAVMQSEARTVSETVDLSLSTITTPFREGIETRCCLNVGGELAMELQGYPLSRWGSRQIVVLHEGNEYRLTLYPTVGIFGNTPADAVARTAFDTFVRSFSFLPVAAIAKTVTPIVTITPVPTPVSAEEEEPLSLCKPTEDRISTRTRSFPHRCPCLRCPTGIQRVK